VNRRAFLRGTAAGIAMLHVPRLARADAGYLYELTSRPANYETARDTFTMRLTPAERFYIRNHFDLPAGDPAGWAKTWRLEIGGLQKPSVRTLADLEAMPQVTVEAVLQCAGNGRGNFRPRVPGVQWRWGAMGSAEWTGVRFADLLGNVVPEAKFVSLQGAERPAMVTTPAFVRGIPIAKAMHPDTIVALRMNGQPLAPHHGYPARLVVPGWVGDDWTKWLTNVQVRTDEPNGFFYDTAYRFPITPGKPGEAVPPDQTRPMSTLVVKAQLGSVSDGDVVAPGAHDLVGVAFSGEARIAKVDVTIDGGTTWQAAELDAHDSDYGFRMFRYAWQAKPGKARIGARATDTRGATQPVEPVWNPSGYLYNAIEFVDVEVR
jgi:DMSO/TMAO reductase YedYZ molybdopterin-dependent catalytic subunit